MTDKYLCKAKRIDNGEWVKGLPSYDINGNITELEIYKGFANCEKVKIDSSTICQRTGLLDKNGKGLWENDVVKNTNSGDIGIIKLGFYNSKHYGFYIKWVGNIDYREDIFYWCNGFLMIVGNTLDNPELLEGD